MTAPSTARCLIALLGVGAVACSTEPQRADTSAVDTVRPTAVTPVALTVADCRPCSVPIVPGAAQFELRFVLDSSAPEQRTVRAIDVRAPHRPNWYQTLGATEMPTASPGDSFFVSAEDINFDGANDLSLIVSRGAANAYAAYWAYGVAADSFTYLGNYPVFTRDTAARELSTYERGGDAGLVYERRRYSFASDTLVLLETEKQGPMTRSGRYRKTLSRLEDGALRVIRVDTVVAGSTSVP